MCLLSFQLNLALELVQVCLGRLKTALSPQSFKLFRKEGNTLGEAMLLLQIILAVQIGSLHVANAVLLRRGQEQYIGWDYLPAADLHIVPHLQLVPFRLQKLSVPEDVSRSRVDFPIFLVPFLRKR